MLPIARRSLFGIVIVLGTFIVDIALARNIPPNVQAFYDLVKPGKCPRSPPGASLLRDGYHSSGEDDSAEWAFCQYPLPAGGKAFFIKGNNKFTNMDIDCDGNQAHGGEGTRCGASSDTQSQTAFKDIVQSYGIKDLDATVHPYVVFGKDGKLPFNPQDHGVKPLSVMAVICGGKVIYGIWGDTNGNDGTPLVGEASLSLATACFPSEGLNGNKGHGANDVLYIAFSGADAAPGKSGANWKAKTYAEFESSIQALGDKLVRRLPGGKARDPGNGDGQTEAPKTKKLNTDVDGATVEDVPESESTCAWSGHCKGATCGTENDCSDALVCKSGKCATP